MIHAARLFAWATVLAAVETTTAAPYYFDTIASGSLGGSGFLTNVGGPGTINNDATAAYHFRTSFMLHDLYSGDVGSSSVLYDTGVDFAQITVAPPIINNVGSVAFLASPVSTPAGSGVFIGNGGPATTIALNTAADPASSISFFSNFIDANDSGRVAFRYNTSSSSGISTGDGGSLTPIADTTGPFSSVGSMPAINNVGTVAFRGTLDTGVQGIFTGNGGSVTTLYDTAGPFSQFFDVAVDINDSGIVAFRATLDGGAQGVFTGDGGTFITIVDSAGQFRPFFTDPAINNAGQVAFEAELDSAPSAVGIYTGPDPVADKVISEGDTFLGGTVTFIDFFRGLNDAGQIVFRAGITYPNTNVDGLFLATPAIPGDFNHDRTVDAADYTFWRKNPGGIYTQNDFNTWQTNFGATLNLGSGASSVLDSTVPEPNSLALLFAAIGALITPRIRVAAKNRC